LKLLRKEVKKSLYSTNDGILLVERARVILWRKIIFMCVA